MSRRIVPSLTLGFLLASAVPGYGQKKEAEFKYLALLPPRTTLEEVSRIAVIDFGVTGRFPRGFEVGAQVADLLTASLTNNRRIVSERNDLTKIISKIPNPFGKKDQDVLENPFGKKDEDVLEIGWASTKIFDLVDRQSVLQALSQIGMAGRGDLQNEQQKSVGERLGADAIIKGSITRLDSGRDTPFTSGKERCLERIVKISVSIEVVDVATGTVLAKPDPMEGSASDRACGRGSRQELATAMDLLGKSLEGVADQLANHISPHFEKVSVQLVRVEGNQVKDQAKRAAKDAKDEDFTSSYQMYSSLLDGDPFNPELSHNLGVLNEIVGNFRQAAERYRHASELDAKSKQYREAVERAEIEAGRLELWEALGMEVAEVQWPSSKSAVAAAAGDQITTRGDRSDRFPVFAEPNEESERIVEIPGGITLTQISASVSRDWIEIQLPGNRTGWIKGSSIN